MHTCPLGLFLLPEAFVLLNYLSILVAAVVACSACKQTVDSKPKLAQKAEVTDRTTTATIAFGWQDGDQASIRYVRRAARSGKKVSNVEYTGTFTIDVAKTARGFQITPGPIKWSTRPPVLFGSDEIVRVTAEDPFDPFIVDERGYLLEVTPTPTKKAIIDAAVAGKPEPQKRNIEMNAATETYRMWNALAGHWPRGHLKPGVPRINSNPPASFEFLLEGHTPGGMAVISLKKKLDTTGLIAAVRDTSGAGTEATTSDVNSEGFILTDTKSLRPVVAYYVMHGRYGEGSEAINEVREWRYELTWTPKSKPAP